MTNNNNNSNNNTKTTSNTKTITTSNNIRSSNKAITNKSRNTHTTIPTHTTKYQKPTNPDTTTITDQYVPEEYIRYFAQQEQYEEDLRKITLDPNHIHMLPLGGVGEIGMNCMMYHYKGRWIMVDCGNTFDRLYKNTSDIVMSDVAFAKQHIDKLDAILITHGHEDHIGALAYLWPHLKVPIYSTKFTNILIRRKFEEQGLPTDQLIDVDDIGSWYDIGTFKAKWLKVCHSIPGSAMIALRTDLGSILHTGDWKIDEKPLLNEHMDWSGLAQLAKEDLHAIVSDSTNITINDTSPTEEDVGKSLANLIKSISSGKIFVTFFSTNISRLHSCIEAAKAVGRKVAIVGRALQRSYESAIEAGYIIQQPHVVLESIDNLKSDNVLIACSGSQGEERSSLTRIANDTHRQVKAYAGDTVLFSCRLIPTNTQEVTRLENALISKGVRVITADDHLIHSSGHAKLPEFEQFYKFIAQHATRKIWSIPVHGTGMFLKRHSAFAIKLGFNAFSSDQCLEDGKIYEIIPTIQQVGKIDSRRCFIDGKQLVSIDSPIIEERKNLQHGVISIVLLLAHGKNLLESHISSYGVMEDRLWLESQIKQQLQSVFKEQFTGSINKTVRSKLLAFTKQHFDKKICLQIHILHSQNYRR